MMKCLEGDKGMLVTRYWMLDTRYWILDTGYWILDTGYWILDLGLNPESRIKNPGSN